MADAIKERSFIPPTSVEYNPKTGGSDTIIWSLGSMKHPWKNLYIMDPDHKYVKEDDVINVYERLAKISIIPYDGTRKPGSFLTSDTAANLIWRPLDEAFKDEQLGVKPESIVLVLDTLPVNRAAADDHGNNIYEKYIRDADNTATYITGRIGTKPVQRAIGDQDGNEFSLTYASKALVSVLDTVLARRNKESTGQINRQVQEVAFSGDYRDLLNTPEGDWVTWKALDQAFMPRDARLNGHDLDIADLYNRTICWYDGATEAYPGVVKVIPGNGLDVTHVAIPGIEEKSEREKQSPQYTTVKVNIANSTNKTYGTICVTPGNGLDYNDATGFLSLKKAEMASNHTSSLGTVKLGVVDDYTYTPWHSSPGVYSAIPADGQWYKWSGSVTVSYSGSTKTLSGNWMTMKLHAISSSYAFCFLYSMDDPSIVLHSNNGGTSWVAPYATWHA